MQTRLRSNLMSLVLLTSIAGSMTGCYTQLYTRGYAERARDSEVGYANKPPPQGAARPGKSTGPAGLTGPAQESGRMGITGDTLLPPDSTLAANGDTANIVPREESSPPIIVEGYYQDRPYYRGYSTWDWDYPIISFGFYSPRYRDYWDPYWWHGDGGRRGFDRGYERRYDRRYDRGSDYRGGQYGGNSGGHNNGGGAYHSDQRLFTPSPSYPQLRKGRRADPPATQSSSPTPQPAAKSGSDSEAKTGSSNGNAPQSQTPPAQDKQESHPAPQKGKRR